MVKNKLSKIQKYRNWWHPLTDTKGRGHLWIEHIVSSVGSRGGFLMLQLTDLSISCLSGVLPQEDSFRVPKHFNLPSSQWLPSCNLGSLRSSPIPHTTALRPLGFFLCLFSEVPSSHMAWITSPLATDDITVWTNLINAAPSHARPPRTEHRSCEAVKTNAYHAPSSCQDKALQL